ERGIRNVDRCILCAIDERVSVKHGERGVGVDGHVLVEQYDKCDVV
ncbi:9201_t:CDS:1, partial [Funneliformis geosporum]